MDTVALVSQALWAKAQDGQHLMYSQCRELENQALCWPEPRGLAHLPCLQGIVLQTIEKGLITCFRKHVAQGQGTDG